MPTNKSFIEKFPEFKGIEFKTVRQCIEAGEILDKHFVRKDTMIMMSINPKTGLPFEVIETQKVKDAIDKHKTSLSCCNNEWDDVIFKEDLMEELGLE